MDYAYTASQYITMTVPVKIRTMGLNSYWDHEKHEMWKNLIDIPASIIAGVFKGSSWAESTKYSCQR